jgi:tetratricopeptide (TPR) repeat protein
MRLLLLWVFFSFLCTGCDGPTFFSTNLRQRAERAEADGKYRQALELYERCIDGTPMGREVHYRMALICSSKTHYLVGALYHFQRFIEQVPKDTRFKEVLEDMRRLRLLLASQLSEGVLVSRAEAIRLRNANLSLQSQLVTLRSQKESPLQTQASSKKKATSRTGPETRTYRVKQGDTLVMISARFYKTPRRWRDIADANRGQLNGSTHLKAGIVLTIPSI